MRFDDIELTPEELAEIEASKTPEQRAAHAAEMARTPAEPTEEEIAEDRRLYPWAYDPDYDAEEEDMKADQDALDRLIRPTFDRLTRRS